jgi:hypothetical protein
MLLVELAGLSLQAGPAHCASARLVQESGKCNENVVRPSAVLLTFTLPP